jgi:Trk-type K+ transport system membrane component
MISIVTLLIVLTLSILITRIATVALTHTGLSRESAKFQARSAFTGVGFTTSESEKVVSHPVRRRILLTLMLLGNAGIVTAVSSLIVSSCTDVRRRSNSLISDGPTRQAIASTRRP